MRKTLVKVSRMLDIFFSLLLVALLIPEPAYAYVDPSVMTYTIQAVAGAAVALGAVLGVALRRTRKVIFRIFKIDENASKVREPAVSSLEVNDPTTLEKIAAADRAAVADKIMLANGMPAKSLRWAQRLVRAMVSCALLVFTLVIASTLEIVAGGASSLNFTFFDVLPLVIGMGLLCWISLSLVISLLKGHLFDLANTLVFVIGLGFYIQALFLNWPMTVADGSPLNLQSKKLIASMIGGGLVWICLIVAMLVFNAKRKAACRGFIMALSFALIIVQGVSVVSIGVEQHDRLANSGPKMLISQNGLFEVSATDNIIVFVLDTTDTQILESILDDDPSILDEYTGFTYFRNSLAAMEPTRYGIPYLLTGIGIEEGDTRASYYERRQDGTAFIEEIASLGYNIGIYSDSIGNTNLYEYMDNIVYLDDENLDLDYATLPGKLLQMSLYRDMPWVLKPAFLFTTDEVNRSSLKEGLNAYVMDDLAYAERVFDGDLQIGDDKKAFRFIHLLGSHYPYVMDAQGQASEERTDMSAQTRGILRVVGNYLHQMKELGVYDRSTVIITADHGIWRANDELLPGPVTPILLVKPAETATEAAEPLRVSDVPTGHLDFHATVIDAAGGDTSAYGSTVFEIEDSERPRYFWRTTMDGGRTNADLDWIEYVVNGHVLDFENWSLTGNTIPITPEDQRR